MWLDTRRDGDARASVQSQSGGDLSSGLSTCSRARAASRNDVAVSPSPGDPSHHSRARRRARAHADEYDRAGRDARPRRRRSPSSGSSARCGASTAPTSTRGPCSRRCRRRRRTCCRARARTPASSRSATGWPSRSRSSRTTTRRRSSRTRAPRRASAASCATCSRWARGRSRCSTRCASARSTHRACATSFAGVVKGIGDYGNCVGIPTVARRSRLRSSVRGQSARQRDVRRPDAGRRADARRGAGRRQPDHRGRRAHRDATAFTARRSRRRICREESDAKRPRVQVGDPFTEKLLLEACLELIRSGAHRRHPGHGRGRPHVVVGGDGGARRRRRRRSIRPRCRCARRA